MIDDPKIQLVVKVKGVHLSVSESLHLEGDEYVPNIDFESLEQARRMHAVLGRLIERMSDAVEAIVNAKHTK